jgi:hypothetical protein
LGEIGNFLIDRHSASLANVPQRAKRGVRCLWREMLAR